MIKFFRILLLLLLFARLQGLFAQDTPEMRKKEMLYPGSMITPDGDTINGYIFYRSLLRNQAEVVFYASATDQQPGLTYKSGEIKGYMLEGMVYHSVPFSGRYSSRKSTFMHCLLEGPVSVYRWYFDEKQRYFEDNAIWDYTNVIDDTLQEQMFLVRKTEKPLELSEYRSVQRFHVVLSRYLADCPALAQKIKARSPGYRFDNLMDILNEYNRCLPD